MSGRPIHAGVALLMGAFLVAGGCARRSSARVPRPPKIGTTQIGIASWYGYPYDGQPSASGEIYDMHKLTAAHQTFPFGTWVQVTDLDNGKKVTVRINDRGPFRRHRIIDLSLAAADVIDMTGPGTARVRLRVVAAPDPPVDGTNSGTTKSPERSSDASVASAISPADGKTEDRYAVQVGAFSSRDRAGAFCDSLRAEFPDVRVVAAGEVWRVLLGRELPIERAKQLAAKVRVSGRDAVVIQEK